MKKLLLLIFSSLLFTNVLKAQYDYHELGVSAGVSLIRPYSDLRQNDNGQAYSLSFFYHYSPYVPFGAEIQFGKLSGGNNITDPSHRYFKNNYSALILHGDLQLGEIVEYENNFLLRAIRGFYMGTGIGILNNNLTDIRRDDLDLPGYVFPGKNRSINLMVPLRFGIEIKIFDYTDTPFMGIMLGYTHNITFGEGMDGYNDPNLKFKNNAPDMYRQITLGVKFNFGNQVSYIKAIR